MRPPRNSNADRLARIDAMLGHLRELEKDTGKIISSLQQERKRTSADMAMNPLHAVRGRTKSTSRKPPRKRTGSGDGRNGR
jgi:hypothetical protein